MNLADYGPFATIIAIAAALAACFSFLLTKAIGQLADWIWLSGDPPEVLLRTAAKAPTIALIAWTYAIITTDNAQGFLILSVVLGVLTASFAVYLQHLIHIHVENIPIADRNGQQRLDPDGIPMFTQAIIGTERSMLSTASVAFQEARARDGSLSLVQFMSGFGNSPYNPQAIWSRKTLAAVRLRLCMFALATVLAAVMSLFLAASSLVAIQASTTLDGSSPATLPTTPRQILD